MGPPAGAAWLGRRSIRVELISRVVGIRAAQGHFVRIITGEFSRELGYCAAHEKQILVRMVRRNSVRAFDVRARTGDAGGAGVVLENPEASTGAGLTFELTKKMGTASWYCGSDLAKQVYEDVMNGRSPTIPASSSTDCKTETGFMIMAMSEMRNRAAMAAAATAKDAVDAGAGKINDAISEKLGVPKSPQVSSFSKLFITFGQTKNQPTVETKGSGFCLEQAKEIFDTWAKSEVLPDQRSQLKSDQTLTCLVDRLGQEIVSDFTCDNWFNASSYNFQSQDITMSTSPVIRMSPKEKAEIEASRKLEQNSEGKLDRLTKIINFGTSFIGVVNVLPSQGRATFEIRGVSRRMWLDRIRTGATKRDSELPFDCSVTTSLNVRVTGPVATDFARTTR